MFEKVSLLKPVANGTFATHLRNGEEGEGGQHYSSLGTRPPPNQSWSLSAKTIEPSVDNWG